MTDTILAVAHGPDAATSARDAEHLAGHAAG
jgi:hypothetical protein